MSSENTSNLLLHFLPQCLSLHWGPEIHFLCLEYLIAWIPGKYKIFIHVIKNWKFIFTVLWVALFIRENDFSKYLNSIELCHKTYLLTLLFWKENQIHSGTVHFSYNLNLGADKSYPKLYHSIFCIPVYKIHNHTNKLTIVVIDIYISDSKDWFPRLNKYCTFTSHT